MRFRATLKIILLLQSMIQGSNADFLINGNDGMSYSDTYIVGSGQSLTVTCGLDAGSIAWTSNVTGPIPSGVHSFQGVNITNNGNYLVFGTFIPGLSDVYTCSYKRSAASILLTTSNPSLRIFSQQPVKVYNAATKFQLSMSSYIVQNGTFQPTPVEDITIHYYYAAREQNFSATFVSTQQQRGTYELIVSWMESSLPSGTTFFITVDDRNGLRIEMSFIITRIELYITPLPIEIIALAGDNVTIDCSPSDPVINVNITFVSLQTTDQQLVANQGLYTLFSVTGSNSGMYECSGYASEIMTFTDAFTSSEMVILTVLPDPVAIEFNGHIIVNVSVINTPQVNTASLTCIGTKGNSKLQWMTFNKTINSYLKMAYLTINGNSDGVDVNDSQLTISNSANSTTLIIGNVNRYSQSFLYCISQESGIKAFTLVTQANPFVITHPDLPSDAALGQNFEMMFVVGIDSDGTKNFIQATGSSTVELMFSFNSTVLNQTAYVSPFDNLPFTVKYQVPISTESEGYYTIAINIIELRQAASITTFLMVIVPSINITTSPINVLQSTMVTLSCVPSDQRSPVVWEYFNDTAGMYEGILDISAYSFGYNGHSITFYTLLMPASIQELNLPSLPDPSLGLIKPIPSLQLSVSYVHTQGSLMFRCSLVNGSTEKIFLQTIQLNTLRDFIQIAATFNDGSQVSLFNDTTVNISPELDPQITSLDCLILNDLGSPTFTTNNSFIFALLQGNELRGINILRTPVSISVHVSVHNPDYIVGNHLCSGINGEAFVVRLTASNPFITNEGSPITTLPLGGIGVLYFQLAASCTNGLTNAAFYEPSSVEATLQGFGSGTNVTTSLSQNSSGLSFVPYVVGPTTIVLYINPVKTINAGVYTVALASVWNANVTLNITVPKLSVAQSVISVYQGNATVISCTPNQFGVQIQWTFLSTNTVLASGYQYTYTINATTPLDEGIYVCSVFGDKANIVETQAVYVNVIAVCAQTYGAGVIWNVAYENQTVLMPCSVADAKFSNVAQMSCQCLPSGQWGAVDFTTCTLRSGVSRPFTMYWSSLVDESSLIYVSSIMNRIPGINITFNEINISSSFGIFSQFGSSLFAILISANFNDQQLIEYYPYTFDTKRQAVLSTSLSYAVVWPSDPCSCRPSLGNQFYLCSNVLSSPCNCTNSTYCQCLPPFVGDGEHCTIDSDLDGVPDTPLNCTGYTYCMKDNCPYIYNPPMNGVQRDVCHGMLKDGCSPVNDTVWDLQWPGTALNSTYVLPCPQGGIDYVSGKAYRFCSSTGDWGPTDVTQCESYTIRYLAQEISSPSLTIAPALGIMNSLFLETGPKHISILPLDLRDSVNILSTMLTLLNTNLQQGGGTDVLNTMIILDVINNLLNEINLYGWQILQTVDPNAASPLLLKTSESYGLYLASAINTTSSITLSRSSIVLQASKVQITANQADMKFPDGNGDLLINATFSASAASITIPGALLLERGNNASSVPVVNMIINNIGTFLPLNGSSTQEVDSLVLSSQVAVEDGGFGSLALQRRPATLSFRINKFSAQYKCSFWNFSNSSWSSEGMLPPSSNDSFVQCYSTHLTSFAVLLAVENFPDSKALTIISYIGCGISMTGLLVTIVFFLTFRKQLLEKPHNFIHLNLAIALFLAFLIFVAGVETAKNNIAACKAVAALLQYFWLSAFCWMMCEGVMLYLMLVVVFSTLKDKWWFFLLLGWVPALVFVVIGLAVRSDYYVVRSKNDNTTISYCWMSTEKGTIWAFAAPVVLILLVNVLFLIMVLVVLCKKSKAKFTDDKVNKALVVSLLKATVILLPVLGCTWIFGLLSVNQYTLVFTWLFTILNSLQGFFIFVCYVLRHEKIWGMISKKYEAWSSSSHTDQNQHTNSTSSHSEKKTSVYSDFKSSTGNTSQKFNYSPTDNKCNVYSDLKISEGIMLESVQSNQYSEISNLRQHNTQCEEKSSSEAITFEDCGNTSFSTTGFSRDDAKSVYLRYVHKDGEGNKAN